MNIAEMNNAGYTTPNRDLIPEFEIGEGVTENMYTDRKAGTVIDVKRNGKEVVVQRDIATLDSDFKPNVIPGGFVGHVINQNEQSYTYERDPNGKVTTFTLRKWRGRYVWTVKGGNPDGKQALSKGRNEFYDYNF